MPAAKGDVVEIINDKDADWWLCRLRGKQGFIPASFIERVSSDREAYQKSGVRSLPTRCPHLCGAARSDRRPAPICCDGARLFADRVCPQARASGASARPRSARDWISFQNESAGSSRAK